MLKDKNILIGVTGGIAIYKICALVSSLKKEGANIKVIMTDNAMEFVMPLIFESLTGNKCYTDTFDRNFERSVEHIELAKWADVFLVAPATANTIAKLSYGIADNMLTTVFLASKCKKIIAPAMNVNMYENPLTRENMLKLEQQGMIVIPADSGYLACGDIGAGKMPEPELLQAYIEREVSYEKDLLGVKVLVTAGATMEAMDPVRYITNHSTGKMGFAIAKAVIDRGGEVVLVKANTSAKIPAFVKVEEVKSANDMLEKVLEYSDNMDVIIKAAAVSDYRVKNIADDKIKKSGEKVVLEFEKNQDILKTLGSQKKQGQILCGFSMETKDMLENSTKKLIAKNADLIIANNLKDTGAGFATDTNKVTIIDKDGHEQLELMSKEAVAHTILDRIIEIKNS
ncbi:MAG: bifunctional phosphopantothenoylcysteine decarboxylase/phosphopantothenate--cysteine ligase CoaBC [Eubacteriales bacterium]|nr:bifunctional phosphopantothenoylcysteine decarboxylase/phosphopantothenate--cysteine ligase CoaBC [Eubacteriales bacterium]MDY3333189.1 bifunctional phosphopantothenoylcysteine decarboxylase/phosphopantothenate--cysteine ligase CoaBC [Gallibacter sp.]